MFGAIYVGLSGLNAYSRGLQQVSGNVSNLNSTGYKATDVSFTNVVAGGSGGGLSLAGSAPRDGGGVELGTVQRNFGQGELRQTQRDLDLAVDGSGFLVLLRGDQVFYTRTGSFEVNKDGFIVLAGTDYRLAALDGSGKAVALSIENSRSSVPEKTTKIVFADNLSSTATSHGISDISVYDASGVQHKWSVQFTKAADAAPGQWTVTVTDDKAKTIGSQLLKFNAGVIDPATSKLVFSDTDNGLEVTLDFSSNVTSYSSGQVSTLRAPTVDGQSLGTLSGVTVNADGEIELAYSNQEKKSLGAVALADFRDRQALVDRGGGLLADNGGAGAELFTSASQRVGQIVSRRLEASNVDLAKQFGDLITIQRGYQASSQIISVANDMIQQLFGIRGQG